MTKQMRLQDLVPTRLDVRGVEIAKTDMYKWADPGPSGRFEMIDKSLLEVDDQYQRNLKVSKSVKIARQLNWSVFGAVTVNLRPDGTYKVIEGQHRVGGIMLRNDIKYVPCLVFELESINEEAGAFSEINSTRAGLTGVEKWKAKVIMGDDDVVLVNSMIVQSGLQVGTGKHDVKCVHALLEEFEKGRSEFEVVWPLLVRLCKGDCISEGEVKALCHIERHAKDGNSLADKVWNRALIPANLDAIRETIRQYRALNNSRRAAALGVLAFINKGRQKRFEINETA